MGRFTWVPAFEEVSKWLLDYENRQDELVSILSEIGVEKGLDDEGEAGRKFVLEELDPFSFFSQFTKYGSERRGELFSGFLDKIKSDVVKPTDFDGVPSAQAMKARLFPYSVDRTPEMVPALWELFKQAHNNDITDHAFSYALSIPNVGFAKLTESLFYAFPYKYFPIDAQTIPFLETNNIAIPNDWVTYKHCLSQVRNKFDEPFPQLSYDAWFGNEQSKFSAQKALDYLKIRYEGTYTGTTHIAAFRTHSGKELAFEPTDDPETKRKIQVFVSDEPPNTDNFNKVESYAQDRSRNHHLKQHAKTLWKGNSACKVTINSIEQLSDLCDWYEGGVVRENNGQENHMKDQASIKTPLNQILYGPPGTGKTYATVEEAVKIADPGLYEKLKNEQQGDDSELLRKNLKARFDELVTLERIVFTTFHQSFSYEDFIEGIRADSKNGSLEYRVQDGVFKKLALNADKATGSGSNIGVSSSPRVWKISIDRKGPSAIRDACFANGEARIGWNDTGDLSLPYEERNNNEREYWDYLSVTNHNTINGFSNEIEVGDVLLCLKDKSTIQAVGIVESDYNFDEKAASSGERDYAHVRKVKWIHTDLELDVLGINAGKRLVQKTLYQLDRISWDDILELLSENGLAPEVESGERPNYVLIIDEINRGNISRIFGELITLLELSKRKGKDDTQHVLLPYSKKSFSVPDNLYVIGTMNTADRSLAQLDLALRRRFSFISVPPNPGELEGINVHGVAVSELLTIINQRIDVLLDKDHLIGHTYFLELKQCESDLEREAVLGDIFKNKIIPLLQEYFFDDWQRIEWVMNDQRKKSKKHRFIIQGGEKSIEKLFGDSLESVSERRYQINNDAFMESLSYKGIISEIEQE